MIWFASATKSLFMSVSSLMLKGWLLFHLSTIISFLQWQLFLHKRCCFSNGFIFHTIDARVSIFFLGDLPSTLLISWYFFKLISNTVYKGIPFIIFLFHVLATKKTKLLQGAAGCTRWWWFNFRSSHTWNKFLLWRFTFNLGACRLRQSIETATTTNVKATFFVNQTWKFKITLIPKLFLVFRLSEHFRSDF